MLCVILEQFSSEGPKHHLAKSLPLLFTLPCSSFGWLSQFLLLFNLHFDPQNNHLFIMPTSNSGHLVGISVPKLTDHHEISAGTSAASNALFRLL